ncbi:TPA: hypothetical protein GX533_00665 [Candidatus Dojkabacteria bacterium]|uniref:DUF5671 domain-containing protein n=1 Tax=Candidatus Dojkabacteria bacterium TaxID=2099670 RepID=A0A832QBY0_9BACT|nr:hypothetical protein [Candidatus Dojkabacteria bacterium]
MEGEYMGVIIFILTTIFSLLFTAGTIYLIVYLVRNKDKKINLGVNTLLHIYLYIISFITLAIATIGTVVFINAAASYKFGIPFSYQLEEPYAEVKDEIVYTPDTESNAEPSCYQGELMEIEGEEVCFDTTKQKKGLVNGATLTISMLILFAIHRITLLFLEKKNTISWLKKAYNFISLIIYSVLSIISIPLSIYLLVNYIYFKPEYIIRIEAPGSMVALAIVSIPLWITFLVLTLKLREKKEK